MPLVTQALIIANCLVYLIQVVTADYLKFPFGLWPLNTGEGSPYPAAPHFHFWQLVTYGFLHGSPGHLFFNMLAVFMFGSDIERVWGGRRYLVYYLTCVISAGIAQSVVSAMTDSPPIATEGASGGVFGLLLAFGMMFPKRMVMLVFPPIPMRAWMLVTLFGLLELVLGVTGTQSGVAHFAHIGGMVGGFLLIQYWRGNLPIKPGPR